MLPRITPIQQSGDYKTGSLSGLLSVSMLTNILGFPPNLQGDAEKVTYEWGFNIGEHRCGVWDYKGNRWSTFGNHGALEALFRELYTGEGRL